jgi:Regulator of G protein signaling domain
LQATHCAENLDFYEAALQYYDAAAAGSGGRVAAARAIADRYVKEGAPNQVNLGNVKLALQH